MLRRKRNANIEDIENEVMKWRAQNKSKVEIILFPGEEEYLTSILGCIAVPLLFEIKGESLDKLKNCPNFIRAKTGRKYKKVYKLKKRERDLLDSLGILYQPLGYIVYLWKRDKSYSCLFY